MFELSTTMTVQMTFRDKERREALVTRRFPSGASLATIEADTLLFVGLANDLSNAVVDGFELKWLWEDATATPAADETLPATASIGLFYRNGDGDVEALWIPAPKSSLFEVAGDYAGIRAEQTATEMDAWTTNAVTLLSGVVTPEGAPFPVEYLVGGLSL